MVAPTLDSERDRHMGLVVVLVGTHNRDYSQGMIWGWPWVPTASKAAKMALEDLRGEEERLGEQLRLEFLAKRLC